MTHDNIRAALAELVALKDLKERFIKFNPQFHWTPEQEREHAGMMLDYERRKPLAWAAARSALSASTQPEGRAFESCPPRMNSETGMWEAPEEYPEEVRIFGIMHEELDVALPKILEIVAQVCAERDEARRALRQAKGNGNV